MSSKIILITGANSGVGYAASKVIGSASPDYHIIMTGRALSKVQAAKSELETSLIKGTLSALHLDVTDSASIHKAAQEVQYKHGRLDVLINNAAVGNRDPDLKTRLQANLETNTIGPAVVAAAFRPLLLKSQNPYSIFVSSGVGSLSQAAASTSGYLEYEEAYRASKAALNMVAVIEARDQGPKGLKVFAMCPGFVVSNLRGTDEESRSGWGRAGDADVSGRTLLGIVEGERDGEVGKFVHKDGVYDW